jgi:hypothetical protein
LVLQMEHWETLLCIYLYVQFEFSHRQTDRHLVRQKSNLESKVRRPCKAPFEIEIIYLSPPVSKQRLGKASFHLNPQTLTSNPNDLS